MSSPNRIPLFFVFCTILSLGCCQWAYPSMTGFPSPPPQMPFQFTPPQNAFMPFSMQPNCYTVCYPSPVVIPNPVVPAANPESCTPPPPTSSPPTCSVPTTPTIPTPTPEPETVKPEETTTRGLRKKNFTVTFELGNYPLDVYYLMDYSGSMQDDKKNLISLSPNLIDSIKGLSSDYQLGFGSFVDKPVKPFGAKSDYSFWNQIPLSKDTSSFQKTVNDTPILNGLDLAEGIFDGLYQTAVCKSEIGWRDNARRIILVTTDAPYHYAEEGPDNAKLTPFDDKCHLDVQGKYTEDATLDYPSEKQIKTVMEENQITVIFAVTTDATDFYKTLSENIKSSKLAALTKDSSNVIDILKESYNEISSSVEIEASGDATNDATINFFSKCSGTEEKTASCTLPASGTVSYTVEVEMDCPIDPSKRLSVNPIGVPSNVDIDISSICK